jgi:ParB-like chromosome segregation protein Spo0J
MKLQDLVVSTCNARTVVEDDDGIDPLSGSIKKHHLISKIVLREKDGVFEIISGQRRRKALEKLHGKDYELPDTEYIIIDADDEEGYLISLAENVYRRNLSPMDLNRAYLKLNGKGHKDKEIAEILGVTPHRLKRLAALSEGMGRIPEEAKIELSKPVGESKFNDLHWSHISEKTDDPDVIKDTVDFILEHETPAKDVPTVLKSIQKNYDLDNIDPDAAGGSGGSGKMDDTPVNTEPTADSPIEYAHKGELVLEKQGDKEILRVLGKDEDQEVPMEHYLEYLRHPEKFKCYVTFKLKVKPID